MNQWLTIFSNFFSGWKDVDRELRLAIVLIVLAIVPVTLTSILIPAPENILPNIVMLQFKLN